LWLVLFLLGGADSCGFPLLLRKEWGTGCAAGFVNLGFAAGFDWMTSKKKVLRVEGAAEGSDASLGEQTATDTLIGRAEILGKYWELANLNPEITKGTITGQLKALDSLCQELGFQPSATEKSADTAEEPADVYRSAWLRSPSSTQ
jgi:hypothetical protein